MEISIKQNHNELLLPLIFNFSNCYCLKFMITMLKSVFEKFVKEIYSYMKWPNYF